MSDRAPHPDPDHRPPDTPDADRLTAMLRIGAALRRANEVMKASGASLAELAAAADEAETLAARLEAIAGRRQVRFPPRRHTAADRDLYRQFSPMMGPANAAAPPLVRLGDEDGHVRFEATFGRAFEGPPGQVSGGIVCAALDEVLADAQHLTGRPAVTGTVTIRFRKSAPLFRRLLFDAWIDRVEGRKRFTLATMHDESGQLLAEAEAVFIYVTGDHFEQRLRERDAGG